MCSICGIVDFFNNDNVSPQIAEEMGAVMSGRGPDQSGVFTDGPVAFQHNRLSVIDPENGRQPMTRRLGGREYTIIYNGELYNTPELTEELRGKGAEFTTKCDTETVLYSYIFYGPQCVERLNGIFAFAVYDKEKDMVFLARDRMGFKPLFFSFVGTTLLFASEIKALLRHPDVRPDVDMFGLWQLIFLSPVRLNGISIFRDIFELRPGYRAAYCKTGFQVQRYWELKAEQFTDSRETAIEKTKWLVTDAIKRQLVSDVPLCTLLSGGIDSSVVSSVAARDYARRGLTLSTYSFEYEGNKESFKSSLFQPQGDDEYAQYMADYIGSEHTILTAPTERVSDYLLKATIARDMPGQSDIDSSLLYFCEQIKKRHTVAISGECADEVFGGYPWFYRKEMLDSSFFPWVHQPMLRAELFRKSVVRPEDGYEALSEKYIELAEKFPRLDTDSETMLQSRKATWLSMSLFMTSLLERKDRMSMASSVEIRVPFADHRIVEYVYNVPWEIKFENGVEKALLRNAMASYLPEEILHRKKSPYPKTHNPRYEALVTKKLSEILGSGDSRLETILDMDSFRAFLEQDSGTWFGQLMSKPQLIAWLIQLEYWLREYNVNLLLS